MAEFEVLISEEVCYEGITHGRILKIFGDEMVYNELLPYTLDREDTCKLEITTTTDTQREVQHISASINDCFIFTKQYPLDHTCHMFIEFYKLDQEAKEKQRAERKELFLELMENKIRQNTEALENYEYVKNSNISHLLLDNVLDDIIKIIKTELLLYNTVKNPNSTKEIFDMLLVKYKNIAHKNIEIQGALVDEGLMKEGEYIKSCDTHKDKLEQFERICYTAIELL